MKHHLVSRYALSTVSRGLASIKHDHEFEQLLKESPLVISDIMNHDSIQQLQLKQKTTSFIEAKESKSMRGFVVRYDWSLVARSISTKRRSKQILCSQTSQFNMFNIQLNYSLSSQKNLIPSTSGSLSTSRYRRNNLL